MEPMQGHLCSAKLEKVPKPVRSAGIRVNLSFRWTCALGKATAVGDGAEGEC